MFLGLDLGTGSLKAALVDAHGQVLGVATESYAVVAPSAGRAETDPAQWWDAAVLATRRLIATVERPPDIRAIGVAAQMHGFVLARDDGVPLRPAILWADDRAADQLSRFRALPADDLARLANPLLPGMAGPILCWLAEHEPTHLAGATWALLPKDWLRFRLVGAAATDPSDASATLLFDVPADTWAADMCVRLGLRADLLPPIAPSTTIAGILTASAADELGLRPGIPVVIGAADTAAAAVGIGVVEAGTAQLTIGTGAQAIMLSGSAVADPTQRTQIYRSAAPAQWYRHAAVQNAGLALDWLRRTLGAEWDELYAISADEPRVDGPLFVPFLTGERSHQPDGASGARFLGVRLDHSRRDLLRAGLEGVACGIRAAVEALPGLDREGALAFSGGSSVHPGWRAMMADVLDRSLLLVDVSAASARGACLLAGVGVGTWPSVAATADVAPPIGLEVTPRAERTAAYETIYRRYAAAWSRSASPGSGEELTMDRGREARHHLDPS